MKNQNIVKISALCSIIILFSINGVAENTKSLTKSEYIAKKFNNKTGKTPVLLKWSSRKQKTRYKVEISQTKNFRVSKKFNRKKPFFPVELFPDTNYFWRVYSAGKASKTFKLRIHSSQQARVKYLKGTEQLAFGSEEEIYKEVEISEERVPSNAETTKNSPPLKYLPKKIAPIEYNKDPIEYEADFGDEEEDLIDQEL